MFRTTKIYKESCLWNFGVDWRLAAGASLISRAPHSAMQMHTQKLNFAKTFRGTSLEENDYSDP